MSRWRSAARRGKLEQRALIPSESRQAQASLPRCRVHASRGDTHIPAVRAALQVLARCRRGSRSSGNCHPSLHRLCTRLHSCGCRRRRAGRPAVRWSSLRSRMSRSPEKWLRERRKITRTGVSAPSTLTYEAIAMKAGFLGETGRPNRDRVKQIEALMGLGWPLRKSHPDFSWQGPAS